jgi:hypothetical protein
MDPEDKFDRWLDAVLRQHGNAEPRAGLEARVMAHLAVQGHGAAWRRWTWVAASSAAAGLVVASLWFGGGRRQNQQHHAKNEAAPPAVVIGKADAGDTTATPSRTARKRPENASRKRRGDRDIEFVRTPKLSQFPSPQPLSEQERLLVAYVSQFPREAAEVAHEQAEREKAMEAMYGVSGPESDIQEER